MKGGALKPMSSEKMGGHQTIDVRLEPAHAGWRLDRALAAAVPTLSRERLKALIRSGAVEARAAAGARSGDQGQRRRATYASRCPSRRPAHNEPQDIPLTIVFEDEHLLVVDKPAGPGRPPGRGQFRRHAGQRPAPPLRGPAVGHRRGGPAGHRPPHRQGHVGPAGRRQDRRRPRRAGEAVRRHSDRPALSGDRRRRAEGQRRARSTRRSPARRPTARRSRSSKARPRQARGDALEAARDRCATRRWSNAGSKPGRTHQVRVHMASIGHPLLGDPVYGRSGKAHRQAIEGAWLSSPGAARGRAWLHPSGDKRQPVVRQSPCRRTCRNCSAHLVYRI